MILHLGRTKTKEGGMHMINPVPAAVWVKDTELLDATPLATKNAKVLDATPTIHHKPLESNQNITV